MFPGAIPGREPSCTVGAANGGFSRSLRPKSTFFTTAYNGLWSSGQGHDRLLCVAALPPFIRAHVDGCTHAQCHHSDDASAGRSRPQAGGYNTDELNQQKKEPEVMHDAWKRAVGAPQLGLAGLLLLLSLACASASAPVTQEPPVSTDTPVANGIAQTVVKMVDFSRRTSVSLL